MTEPTLVSTPVHANDGGKIGPNAIIRMGEALEALYGRAETTQLFAAAGLEDCLHSPPTAMIDENWVVRLHTTLRASLPPAQLAEIGRDAGRRTGDYLLAKRIPKPAQRVLRLTPAPLAARILVPAIAKHAWTFTGSGRFSAEFGNRQAPLLLTICDGPVCRGAVSELPVCDFYAGTFARIFRELVSARTTVEEIHCQAQGAPACVFAVRW
ncbi:bacteriochlorophyll 4-vinyl reductase [Rhodocyclus gracilis]|uniref:bacteriochlorophyll 4-vinyl reductase n=1 Tax=Rhodocyclus gracilis TaxID=2929842 RepID=UPI001ADBAB70